MDRLYALSENVRRKIPIPSYLFAVLITIAVAIIRITLQPILGTGSALLLFYLAVVISGWYGGFAPTLITVFLSASVTYIAFTEPYFEVVHKGADDTIRMLIFIVGGILVGMISESRLRHERRIENLLKENISSRRRAEKGLLFRNQFISIASHELKTPLTTADLILQVLIGKTKNKNTLAHLNNIKGQLDRLTRLVNDFLDISKIQNGKLQIQKADINLNELTKEVVKLARLTIKNQKVYIRGRVAGTIRADKERIGQVITNLISNASKYSRAGSKIIVSLKDMKSSAIVSVKDYGIGIRPESQKKIFRRFYRVEGKNEKVFSGFGIGLYICSEIIKRHKGKIWVESELNKGSTFSFSLPRNH